MSPRGTDRTTNRERSEGFAIGERVRITTPAQGLLLDEIYSVEARFSEGDRVVYVVEHECSRLEIKNLPLLAEKVQP